MKSEAVAGLQIIDRMPALITTIHQQDGPAFDTNATYLANFLNMFTGTLNPDHLKVLQVTQILQMEHDFNADTFTSHVVGSTLAPVDTVISAAIGALFGILHGGADQAALQDAKRVGCPEMPSVISTNCLLTKHY
jgi:citrate synthase|tara:strand:+ start:346 stop:750 length:405 start_codon:yes stop_codon:yes gene_type:complete